MRRHTTTMNMTEGRPLALLSVFALPLLIGNLFQQAYNLADSMIVGQILGADSLAAVGATGSISFLFFSIFNGISSGCGIVTAQYFGARNDRMVCKSIANSAYIMLASSLLTGTLAFVMVPTVLTWMGTPAEILPETLLRELRVRSPGCVLIELPKIDEINAAHGRLYGDKYIRDFAITLDSVGSKYGFIGRNSGNEFLVIIESCPAEKMQEFVVLRLKAD